MKLLILGARGMAGHVLLDYFQKRDRYDVWGTARSIDASSKMVCLDVHERAQLVKTIEYIRPDAVINAIGLLNDDAAHRVNEAIDVNARLPHFLAEIGQHHSFKLIHISTDCVFSGLKGNYNETDVTDGTSIYAKTKSLGEVIDDTNLTIRTSIIGPELKPNGIGLFQWFSQQEGPVYGYRRVYWNGVTTLELAKAIEWTLTRDITGLIHLAGPAKISKFELLQLFKQIFNRDEVDVIPCDEPKSDKTLVNTRPDFTFEVKSYVQMLRELHGWMEGSKLEL